MSVLYLHVEKDVKMDQDKPLTVVYYFPTDGKHEETGEAFPVRLKADGTADLSKLPPDMRSHLEFCGTPTLLHSGKKLYAKDGERFLRSLLDNVNQCRIFRSSPRSYAHVGKIEYAQVIPFRRLQKRRG